ncbi:MAG: hypothetical protein V1701_03220 [Planctomycetota bacterium]
MANNDSNNFWQFFNDSPRSKKKIFGMIDQDRKKPLGGSYASHGVNSEDQEEDFLAFYDCGHPGHSEPGGKCVICGAIICKECAKRCANCGIPVICPQDVCIVDNVEVCLGCAEELRWRKGIGKVWSIILSPFRKSRS